MRGAFIVLEGLDRSGKSTQASMLCDYLQSSGRKVSLWKYPARETFLGKYVRFLNAFPYSRGRSTDTLKAP